MIAQAAIRQNGKVHVGRSHGDIIFDMARGDSYDPVGAEHGFVTESGRFVDRREAYEVALKSGQIQDGLRFNRCLFSQDLGL